MNFKLIFAPLIAMTLLNLMACETFQQDLAPTSSSDTPAEVEVTSDRFRNDNSIPLSEAKIWTKAWQEASKNSAWWKNNLFHSFTIPTESITPLLAKRANEIRTYLALDEEGNRHLLLVGVDAEGKDMLNEAAGELIYRFSLPCPQFCGDASSNLFTGPPQTSTIQVEGNQITLENAIESTTQWRATPKDEAWWSENEFHAFTIASSNFKNLLTEGAVAFRAYLAINAENTVNIVLAGVDEENKDKIEESQGNRLYDFALPCPKLCDNNSPLLQ